MLDRSIPFFNTILRCDHYAPQVVTLPHGYTIVPYQPGFELAWAQLEHAVGDFDTLAEAENYFVSRYVQAGDPNAMLFLLNETGLVIGSCIAWHALRQGQAVNSLDWLIVAEPYQGRGFGRALSCAVMNEFSRRNDSAVYIHTQPWSYKAIFLYISLGFKLQKTDTFDTYSNQYVESLAALKARVSEAEYQRLLRASQS